MDKIYLTPREQELFDLIITRGCSNKVLARLMNLTESTVKMHTGNILQKYNVRTKMQLVVFVNSQKKQ